MNCIQDSDRNLSPLLQAALLLAARGPQARYDLAPPTAKSIFEATGAGRTRAYEVATQLMELLPSLERPVGRPRKESANSDGPVAGQTPLPQDEVLDYVMANPGCVSGNKRNRYTPPFRCFILELRERYPSMPVEQFAAAVRVPIKTLQSWVRKAEHAFEPEPSDEPQAEPSLATEPENHPGDNNGTQRPEQEANNASRAADLEPETRDNGPDSPASAAMASVASEPATDARIQTVLDEHKRWKGSFSKFCKHIKDNCFIDYGRSTISNILSSHGVRFPKRRNKRSPDECALRKSFETFFPGAQWVGDGHEITFTLCGEPFKFNLELLVDTAVSAMVGGDISPHEDSDTLIRAHDDGVATTGHRPLAILLDNRHSNHTEQVKTALSESLLIRSTLGRAQNKAHVEGAFGLFQQTIPDLELNADTPRELAAGIVKLIVITWARTLNHKKLSDRGNRSRVELYRDNQPSPEQIQQARIRLAQRQRRQEKARQTELARQDPIKRKLLEEAFEQLGLQDPDGNVQLAISRYPLDAIIEGIATFTAQKKADDLPEGAGARYLRGIVFNINAREVAIHLVDELLRLRLQARDMLLDHLVTEHQVVQKSEPELTERIGLYLARALDTESLLTRLFWLRCIADEIRATPQTQHEGLTRRVTQRIILNYRIPRATRHEAIRYLMRLVFPVH